jgi:hypothetical protein
MLVLVFCCIADGEDGYNKSLLIFDKEKVFQENMLRDGYYIITPDSVIAIQRSFSRQS